jgi:hypothetical protein
LLTLVLATGGCAGAEGEKKAETDPKTTAMVCVSEPGFINQTPEDAGEKRT